MRAVAVESAEPPAPPQPVPDSTLPPLPPWVESTALAVELPVAAAVVALVASPPRPAWLPLPSNNVPAFPPVAEPLPCTA
jgi:hypothetical protein